MTEYTKIIETAGAIDSPIKRIDVSRNAVNIYSLYFSYACFAPGGDFVSEHSILASTSGGAMYRRSRGKSLGRWTQIPSTAWSDSTNRVRLLEALSANSSYSYIYPLDIRLILPPVLIQHTASDETNIASGLVPLGARTKAAASYGEVIERVGVEPGQWQEWLDSTKVYDLDILHEDAVKACDAFFNSRM